MKLQDAYQLACAELGAVEFEMDKLAVRRSALLAQLSSMNDLARAGVGTDPAPESKPGLKALEGGKNEPV